MNKKKLNDIICQSSSDYRILNDAYDYIKNLEQQCKKQQEVIDKAIEYINNYESITAFYEYIDEDGNDEYSYDKDFKKELLDILNEVSEMNIYSVDKIYESYSNEVERMQKCIDELLQENQQLKDKLFKIETLIINHNCDTGDIYYKYNSRFLKSESKERILEILYEKRSDSNE